MFSALLALALASNEPPPYVKPLSSTSPRYIEALEENTHLIYPAIAVLTVALIAFGIIAAWRTEDIDGIQKAEIKREIVRTLRRDIHGVTADHLARTINVSSLKVAKILEEMAADGILESRTDTRRLTTWRLKGLVS